jgi:hypothetical protein
MGPDDFDSDSGRTPMTKLPATKRPRALREMIFVTRLASSNPIFLEEVSAWALLRAARR